jgi:hypothetical protein
LKSHRRAAKPASHGPLTASEASAPTAQSPSCPDCKGELSRRDILADSGIDRSASMSNYSSAIRCIKVSPNALLQPDVPETARGANYGSM